jgi:hypothetical protein
MDQQPNPYAAPRAETDLDPRLGGVGVALRREGDLLVVPTLGATFPPRCVICNQPAQRRLRRKLFWHPPGYYALICIGALIYVIAAMIVRKSAEFEVGLCDEHSARRRNGIIVGWLGAPLCFVAGIAVIDRVPILSVVLIVASLGLIVASLLMARIVVAARIQDNFAWIKVGKPFLDSIP